MSENCHVLSLGLDSNLKNNKSYVLTLKLLFLFFKFS